MNCSVHNPGVGGFYSDFNSPLTKIQGDTCRFKFIKNKKNKGKKRKQSKYYTEIFFIIFYFEFDPFL